TWQSLTGPIWYSLAQRAPGYCAGTVRLAKRPRWERDDTTGDLEACNRSYHHEDRHCWTTRLKTTALRPMLQPVKPGRTGPRTLVTGPKYLSYAFGATSDLVPD